MKYHIVNLLHKVFSLLILSPLIIRLTDLMLEFGSNLDMPHTRFIEEGLIELRIKSKEGIARVFYCTMIGKKIIMLHLFIKKSNKTPKKEIQIAKNRMKEVLRK